MAKIELFDFWWWISPSGNPELNFSLQIMRLEQRIICLQNANNLNSCATCRYSTGDISSEDILAVPETFEWFNRKVISIKFLVKSNRNSDLTEFHSNVSGTGYTVAALRARFSSKLIPSSNMNIKTKKS